MRVLMKHDAQPLLLAIGDQRDVVDVATADEQTGHIVDNLALIARLEGSERRVGRKDDYDGWDRCPGGAGAEHTGQRFAKPLEPQGNVAQRAAADVADDDEIRTVETSPFGEARSGIEQHHPADDAEPVKESQKPSQRHTSERDGCALWHALARR
jgi:hypothetical protein